MRDYPRFDCSTLQTDSKKKQISASSEVLSPFPVKSFVQLIGLSAAAAAAADLQLIQGRVWGSDFGVR